ncbi:MAG: AMP-binding protein [Myxococcota bacterium]
MADGAGTWGRLEGAEHEGEQRSRALADPGSFHGDIASAELHWYDAGTWWRRDPATGSWSGFDATSGAPAENAPEDGWRPWAQAFDDADAPFYRWYVGAKTNACFNEIDRHLLAGHGEKAAFLFEGDRWDPSKNEGKGGPVVEETVSYRKLFIESVVRAEVLAGLGLGKGDRVAFNLPNILEQLYYTEAAKRLGIIYTPVFGGFSAKTLSDRIYDAGAKVVITADGGYRNAEVVPYTERFTDVALDNFIPRPTALAVLEEVLGSSGLDAAPRLASAVTHALAGEITVERSDVMRELGKALRTEDGIAPERSAEVRTAVARALAEAKHDVETVVVIRYTGQEIVVQARDQWSDDLVKAARERVHAEAGELEGLGDRALFAALAKVHPATPVDSDWPCFIIYTSGSTGKPKGVVHGHGGWLSGVAHTMRTVFGADEGDRLYVIADPGWITGQSYLIGAPLAVGITSIVAEGSPLFPHAGRFSSIIARHGATIFKAGSTFLKSVMTDPASTADMSAYDMSSLKVATFCAEPVSPAVQQFAMDEVCQRYINSYWATEHGGVVFTCPWGDVFDLQADAKTWPLPWIDAEVRVATARDAAGRATEWRKAERGEKGELVVTKPYPYLAKTIWGDAENLGTDAWRGDLARFTEVYFDKWSGGLTYTQGDYARQHEDGAFTLHGRSDDVINVSGHRIGTEEIEGAILRDKVLRPDSPVGNAVVVGAPDEQKGEAPIAFLIPAPGAKIGDADLDRLKGLVKTEKGVTAVPSDFLVVSQFPETRSGKYMRRTLRALLLDLPLGDTSTLRNPESVDEIREAVHAWRAFGRLAEARKIVSRTRYLRVETHELAPGKNVALVIIDAPPVNSLNERSLDELHTVLHQIARDENVHGVVVTGAGKAFVAGANVKELLEVGEAGDRDSAQTLPNAAQTAFGLLEKLGKPVIAAVTGPALGGGNELVLACAYAVADKGARFGQPEINLRLLPGYGGTQRLVRRLHARHGEEGVLRAVRMIIDGRGIEAREAVAIGLVDELVPAGHAPLEHAVGVMRAYFHGEGPLVAAMEAREAYLASAEKPLAFATDIRAALATPIAQAESNGRSSAVARILDAVRTGLAEGQSAGLAKEGSAFADAIVDPEAGPVGIPAFLERRSAPLPLRDVAVPADADDATRKALEAKGELIPIDGAFYPGVTPVPPYMYALGVPRDRTTAAPAHGDPKDAEKLVVVPVPEPGPSEALVYMLASEINYNDIWAITGIPVSPFDPRDVDVHVTGSGGCALVVRLGEELVREGRITVGDLVTLYSGQSELMSPDQGLDPMAADFRIQGYERNDGSHAQFLTVQGPQLHKKLGGQTLEEAGSYGLNAGTIHRALFTTLDIQPEKRLFVEGASTGTGLECLRGARATGLEVVGMVSSEERAERVRSYGGQPVNRKDERWASIFTPVPDAEADWAAWEEAGAAFVADVRKNGPVDYAVSHAGERAFSRTFQLLSEGGVLTFFGASSGYRFSFLGKEGAAKPRAMLQRARLAAGRSFLVIYGPGAEDGIVDPVAIEAIEIGCGLGAKVAVLTDTIPQRELVTSLGFGSALGGVVSVEELKRRFGDDFDPPGPFMTLPNAFQDSPAFKEAVRSFSDRTLKPVGSAIAPFLRTPLDKRGLPDVVFERAGRDGLGLSSSLVKPNTGVVVYAEDLGHRRFSFYAPQVWMRQRRVLMPTAEIRGTHLNTAREFAEVQARVAAGRLDLVAPTPVDWDGVPEAHQAMWENRHAGATYVFTHGLPRLGLKTKDELYQAWAIRDAEARGEGIARIDTGSASTLR